MLTGEGVESCAGVEHAQRKIGCQKKVRQHDDVELLFDCLRFELYQDAEVREQKNHQQEDHQHKCDHQKYFVSSEEF